MEDYTDKELKNITRSILNEMGMRSSRKGYGFWVQMILMVKDKDLYKIGDLCKEISYSYEISCNAVDKALSYSYENIDVNKFFNYNTKINNSIFFSQLIIEVAKQYPKVA